MAAIHFDDGQHVEEGDLLVELLAREEQALLAEAIAVRDDRLVNYMASKTLFDQNLVSERDFEAARALKVAAEARVQSLEAAIAGQACALARAPTRDVVRRARRAGPQGAQGAT